MNWCIQNVVVVVIICTPAAFLRSILHYIPYKQKSRNRKEIGFNVQYEQFLAFFSSLVLRMLAVSNVYVTLSNTCRHDGFHRYEQFLYILGGLMLLESLIYKPKFIDKISLCSLETGEKTAGSERRRKKHTGF